MFEIHKATQRGDADEVKRLLSEDPSLLEARQSTWENRTPLHVACCVNSSGYIEVVALLIEAGADLNARNSDGETPLHLAVKAVEESFTNISEDVLSALLGAGADVNAQAPPHDWTPLHEAAVRGNKRFVEILLQSGADTRRKSNRSSTPLDAALARSHEDVAHVLSLAEKTGPRKGAVPPDAMAVWSIYSAEL